MENEKPCHSWEGTGQRTPDEWEYDFLFCIAYRVFAVTLLSLAFFFTCRQVVMCERPWN